MLIINTHNHLG